MARLLRGSEKLLRKLQSLSTGANQEIASALNETAFKINEKMVNSVQESGSSGREYTRGNKKHVASAPGSPPNTDTGQLVRSMYVDRATANHLVARIGADAPYAKYLEFGTSRMDARPFLEPAFNEFKDEVNEKIRDLINKELRK